MRKMESVNLLLFMLKEKPRIPPADRLRKSHRFLTSPTLFRLDRLGQKSIDFTDLLALADGIF